VFVILENSQSVQFLLQFKRFRPVLRRLQSPDWIFQVVKNPHSDDPVRLALQLLLGESA
jgi:hypothetical protein